jgi:hypothetical protein
MSSILKAFEGEPATTVGTENGQPVITVSARYLRPDEAEGADVLGIIIACGAVALAGWIGFETMEVSAPVIGLFCGGLLGRPFMQLKLRQWCRMTSIIKLTADRIFFQKAPFGVPEKECQQFDRRHPHRFVLLPHDKARAETDEIEYLTRNKPGRRVARYFTDSWVVVLEYMGQRYDLAEVMGKRRATAILDRLVLCDQYMDSLVSAGQKLPLRPEDEWAGAGGSVPR